MVSCLGLRKDDTMVFNCENLFMTCWSTVEFWELVLGLITEGCIVMSDCILVSILYMLFEALEVLCAEATDALAPRVGDLKVEDLLSHLCLMCVFKKLNLS